MSTVRPRFLTLLAIAVLSTALLMSASCAKPAPADRDVADSSGLFHFRIPSDWQALVEGNTVSVYAAESLPEEGARADALSMIVYVSSTTTATPVPEGLLAYIDYWSESRGWTDKEVSLPTATTVGDREATRVDITGVDANGNRFQAAYIWVRTAGREVLITAFTPPERWAEYSDDLDLVLEQWFWLQDDNTAPEEPASP